MIDDVDILLFDEPLANLDPATGKKAIALIDRIQKEQKKTIVIIEHRLEDVLYKDGPYRCGRRGNDCGGYEAG